MLAGAAYGILSGNWSFALVILLLGAVYYLTRNAPAVMGEITVTDYGFQLNDVFTAWNDCQDFWLIATPDYMELHILRKKGWNREAVIQTGDVDPQLIRQALSELLPERSNMKEKLLDAFIRICKL
ncbi:MAG: hypothetical protein JWM56_872 [Candidatus Peribacteria bacterium]|nr:hypothetical protein [Candidatus Peribacteria bacterium]